METRKIKRNELEFEIVTHRDKDENSNWYYTTIKISDSEGNYVRYADSPTMTTSYIQSAKIGTQKLYRNYNDELVKCGRGKLSKATFNSLSKLLYKIDTLFGDKSFDGFGNIGSIQTGVVLTYGYCGVRHSVGGI